MGPAGGAGRGSLAPCTTPTPPPALQHTGGGAPACWRPANHRVAQLVEDGNGAVALAALALDELHTVTSLRQPTFWRSWLRKMMVQLCLDALPAILRSAPLIRRAWAPTAAREWCGREASSSQHWTTSVVSCATEPCAARRSPGGGPLWQGRPRNALDTQRGSRPPPACLQTAPPHRRAQPPRASPAGRGRARLSATQ